MQQQRPTLLRFEFDEELLVLAARIRPLPEAVAPSAEFLTRTRLRLLQLPSTKIDVTQRAA